MIIDKIKIKYKLTCRNKMLGYVFDPMPLDMEKYGILNVKQKSLALSEKICIGAWRDMYWYEMDGYESSFAFFYAQYGANYAWDYDICMVEYNPNKTRVPPNIVSFLVRYFAKVKEIVSIDVAFDFPNVPVTAFLFDCNGNTDTMTYGNVANTPTRYLRPKANDGRVKIYDKGKEREGKKDENDFKGVTRVEVTYHNVAFLVLNVYKHDWGHDIMNRLKSMLDDLNSVKVPGVFKNVSSSGLNLATCYAIDTMLEDGRADRAQQIVSFLAPNSRSKYRRYIEARREYRGVFDGNEIEFGFALADEVSRILIA